MASAPRYNVKGGKSIDGKKLNCKRESMNAGARLTEKWVNLYAQVPEKLQQKSG